MCFLEACASFFSLAQRNVRAKTDCMAHHLYQERRKIRIDLIPDDSSNIFSLLVERRNSYSVLGTSAFFLRKFVGGSKRILYVRLGDLSRSIFLFLDLEFAETNEATKIYCMIYWY